MADTRLGKLLLLLLLASDKAGEAAAAAAAVVRALKADGRDIHWLADVVERAPLTPEKAPFTTHNHGEHPWHAMRAFCLEHRSLLRGRELEFVTDLEDWRGKLTPKQNEWLIAIYERVKRATGG